MYNILEKWTKLWRIVQKYLIHAARGLRGPGGGVAAACSGVGSCEGGVKAAWEQHGGSMQLRRDSISLRAA